MPKLLDGGIYGDISCAIYAPWPTALSQRGRVPIAKGVEFVEKNVRADKLAMKELIDQGFQSTPVTMTDGQSVVASSSQKTWNCWASNDTRKVKLIMKPSLTKSYSVLFAQSTAVAFFIVALCSYSSFAQSKTIIDEWSSVQAPKPPELKAVKIDDPKTTAYLVLDIVKQTCNNERRPRCVTSVPKIQGFLKQARAKGLAVVYSKTSTATPADIIQDVAPTEGEPMVSAAAEKFYKTDLEKILQEKGIKTVIVVGTAAHGAVLFTGTEAAKRGFKVIVPVDGMSAENTYIEQYTAWHLVNNPSYAAQVTLTKFDMIGF